MVKNLNTLKNFTKTKLKLFQEFYIHPSEIFAINQNKNNPAIFTINLLKNASLHISDYRHLNEIDKPAPKKRNHSIETHSFTCTSQDECEKWIIALTRFSFGIDISQTKSSNYQNKPFFIILNNLTNQLITFKKFQNVK